MPDEPDARFRERLIQEIDSWRRAGVVGDRIHRRILDHYGIASPSAGEKRVNRLAVIIGTLGGLLVGIGVILLVASNWDGVPRLLKVGLVTGALAALLGAAYWARFRREHGLLSASLLLLSSLVYGAAIFLVGQAYHVPAGDPGLLLMWSLGTGAMAYATSSKGVLIISILALEGWLLGAASRLTDSFQLTMLTGLLFGVLLLAVGEIHRTFENVRRLGGSFALTGLITILFPALLLSFSFAWDFFPQGDSFIPLLIVGVIAAAALGAMAVRWGGSRPMLLEAGGGLALLVATVIAALVPGSPGGGFGSQGNLFHSLLFNVLVVGSAFWAIVVGLRTDRDAFVNTALVFIGLLILARYFDFSFGLFDRSIVFIGAGIVLLGTAVGLDRLRRRLTRPEGSEAA